MFCQNCGKNFATRFYKENINGYIKHFALCSKCAENDKKLKTLFNIPSLDNDFMDFQFLSKQNQAQKVCKNCMTTENDIRKTGRVGCGECYKNFEKILTPYIKKIQGCTTHIGTETSLNSIDELKKQLKKAIENESYEEAAKIRDEIKRKEVKNNE